MAKIYNVEIENIANNTVDTYSIAIPYGACSTGASTAAKVVNSDYLSSITLEAGVQIKIKFTNGNTAANPTLKINNASGTAVTTAKSIVANTNLGISANKWAAGCVLDLVYDGTAWVISSIGAFNNVSVSRSGNTLSWDTGFISSGSTTGIILVANAATLHSYLVAANAGIYYKYTGATTTISGVTYINGNLYTYDES